MNNSQLSNLWFWKSIERDVITVTGSDAKTYLHSQLSQDIASMQPGDVRMSLLLQPTGKVDSLLRVTCAAADRFVLDCDPGFGESTVARLSRFKIRVNAEIELQRQTWRAVRSTETAARTNIAQTLDVSGAIPAWRCDGSAFDIFSPTMVLPATLQEGTEADLLEARVRALWPEMGVDITTEMIPAETSVVEVAVSFTKGCYPGQELVERMDSRGSMAPRRLCRVICASGTHPQDEVLVNGEAVGKYTTVSGMIALALIKRGVEISDPYGEILPL
jgi:folate-binding protein YgfZ